MTIEKKNNKNGRQSNILFYVNNIVINKLEIKHFLKGNKTFIGDKDC